MGAADFGLLYALVAFYAFGFWGFFCFLFTFFPVLVVKSTLKDENLSNPQTPCKLLS